MFMTLRFVPIPIPIINLPNYIIGIANPRNIAIAPPRIKKSDMRTRYLLPNLSDKIPETRVLKAPPRSI
jgi:hypothetical protein